jgi:hypothetical protein
MVITRSMTRGTTAELRSGNANTAEEFCCDYPAEWVHFSRSSGSVGNRVNLEAVGTLLALPVLFPSTHQYTNDSIIICIAHKMHLQIWTCGDFQADFQGHYHDAHLYMNHLNQLLFWVVQMNV